VRKIVVLFMIPVFSHFNSWAQTYQGKGNSKYEPPDSSTYHGVGWGEEAQINYQNMFGDNCRPLLFQVMLAIPGNPQRPLTVERILNSIRASHIDPDKQYAEISIHFMDTGGPTPIVLDTAFAYTSKYDHYIDTLAEALVQHGRAVFIRPGLEANGGWNGYTPWAFPLAFRKLVNGLRVRGVSEFASIWCYEPDADPDFADSTEEGWKWYPGDDVVDWFGLDLFDADHFDPGMPDSAGNRLTKKGRSEAFIKFAKSRGKPIYLNELSARHVYITPDINDPDSSDGRHDWESWFEPFFEFLDMHPEIKAFNYIDLNWDEIKEYEDWGDARIEINTYIKNRWIKALSGDRFLHAGTDPLNPTLVLNDLKGHVGPDPEPIISAFPNPFNPSTILRIKLEKHEIVKIEMIDILGRRVDILFSGFLCKGVHQFSWKPSGLAGGIYFARVTLSHFFIVQKLVYFK